MPKSNGGLSEKWITDYRQGNFPWPWPGLEEGQKFSGKTGRIEPGMVFALGNRPKRLLILIEISDNQYVICPCSLCDTPATDDEFKLNCALVAQIWDARFCYNGNLPDELIRYGSLDNSDISTLRSFFRHFYNEEPLSDDPYENIGVPMDALNDDDIELVREFRECLSDQLPTSIFVSVAKALKSPLLKALVFTPAGNESDEKTTNGNIIWIEPSAWKKHFDDSRKIAAASTDETNDYLHKLPSTTVFSMQEDENIRIRISVRKLEHNIIGLDIVAENVPDEYPVTIYLGDKGDRHDVRLISGRAIVALAGGCGPFKIGVEGASSAEVIPGD